MLCHYLWVLLLKAQLRVTICFTTHTELSIQRFVVLGDPNISCSDCSSSVVQLVVISEYKRPVWTDVSRERKQWNWSCRTGRLGRWSCRSHTRWYKKYRERYNRRSSLSMTADSSTSVTKRFTYWKSLYLSKIFLFYGIFSSVFVS